MNVPVRILSEAAEEAIEAASWYEFESPGLGAEFSYALEAAIDLIEDGAFPLLPVLYKHPSKSLKRLILKQFPYDVVVLERPEEKIIVAVAHHARRPGVSAAVKHLSWLQKCEPSTANGNAQESD